MTAENGDLNECVRTVTLETFFEGAHMPIITMPFLRLSDITNP
jgi:hypothetical protein